MLISIYEVAVDFPTYMGPPSTGYVCYIVTDMLTECAIPMQFTLVMLYAILQELISIHNF
jgi:hypothetical protein